MKFQLFRRLFCSAPVFIIILISCNFCSSGVEEEIIEIGQDFAKASGPGFTMFYSDVHPLGFCCYHPGNCFYPPIEIVGATLFELDSCINLGAGGVQAFFSDHHLWEPIFPMFQDSANWVFLDHLQSGNFTVVKKPARDNLIHYVAAGGSPIVEFVIQVDSK